MAKFNPSDWAKRHKRKFANKLIARAGVDAREYPSAIFMAGLPGAGKTEFTKQIIQASTLKVVRIDMDEIASQISTYSPDKANLFRSAATTLLNEVFSRTTRKKVDFIMDGTFGSKHALGNIQKALSRGYAVKIIYIHQDPKLAWQFVLAREKVEHRAIDRESFIHSYYQIIKNIKELDNPRYADVVVDLIIKNQYNDVDKQEENISIKDIDTKVNTIYNKNELTGYLNGQN